ncbi:MAG: hypothetical protein SOY02_06595 [Candidatus Onthovivens sp.]|nr:hypothetical protein [Candidatus Onthovivens sp.]
MEKKLKFNAFLKGVSIFAFVAFCLLAILAGVTLPFASRVNIVDNVAFCSESDISDLAVASAESGFNYLDYSIPLSQCNTNDIYYGFYFTDDFVETLMNLDLVVNGEYTFAEFNFTDVSGNSVTLMASAQSMGSGTFNYVSLNTNRIQLYGLSSYDSMYSPTIYVSNSGFKFTSFGALDPNYNIYDSLKDFIYVFNQLPLGGDTSALENQIASLTAQNTSLQAQLTDKQNQIDTLTAEKTALQAQLTEKQNQIDTLTAEKNALQSQVTEKQNQIDTLTAEKNALQTELSNLSFSSRFGNFVGLASSDFYINLDVAPVIPSQLCQVLVAGSDSLNDNWYLKAQSLDLNIYYLPLFDKYYLNGSVWIGDVNCGWVLDYFYGKKVPQLRFRVFGTDIWKADCDFTKNTGLISNVRNGKFLVSSNFISDANVYKISSADDSLYIMRDVYNDVAYSSFLDSFIAQQDFKNVKIPSDNALYLKGYQSASDEYYNNGYNTGFSEGQKSGYNTGFIAGDSAGYSRGLEDSNNYSFLSLFGAVFDAPIQALFGGTQRLPAGTKITDSNGNTITLQTATTVNRGGLLNFELMGVNLSGFVLALFSLSILIVVIKFALGKGR